MLRLKQKKKSKWVITIAVITNLRLIHALVNRAVVWAAVVVPRLTTIITRNTTDVKSPDVGVAKPAAAAMLVLVMVDTTITAAAAATMVDAVHIMDVSTAATRKFFEKIKVFIQYITDNGSTIWNMLFVLFKNSGGSGLVFLWKSGVEILFLWIIMHERVCRHVEKRVERLVKENPKYLFFGNLAHASGPIQ